MRFLVCLLAGCLLSAGCARMIVIKNPQPNDNGIRFYRPKPYLFIGPAMGAGGGGQATEAALPPEAAATDGKKKKSGTIRSAKTTHLDRGTTAGTMPVVMRIEYLPDYSEEYSIRMKPGLGTTKMSVNLENGWNLTSVNTETDQKYAEIISSLAQLTGSAAGAVRHLEGHNAEAESDVPLGYYEAVLAVNECGGREIMGWRYVGFFPGLGCPVKACVDRGPIACDPNQLYAVVFDGATLKMKKLSEMGFCPPETYDMPMIEGAPTDGEPIQPGRRTPQPQAKRRKTKAPRTTQTASSSVRYRVREEQHRPQRIIAERGRREVDGLP